MDYYLRRFNLIAVFLIVALCSFPVNAATMSVENNYYGYANSTTSGISVTYDNDLIVSFAGLLKVNYEGFDTWGFCVDLNTPLILETVDGGSTSFDYITTSDPVTYADNLVYVEWLLDTYADEAYNQGWSTDGAALQLAIWEVLYDIDLAETNYNLDLNGETTITTVMQLLQ